MNTGSILEFHIVSSGNKVERLRRRVYHERLHPGVPGLIFYPPASQLQSALNTRNVDVHEVY